MPTPMHVFDDVARKYGNVDPEDAEAVAHFWENVAPTLPEEKRLEILAELLARETEPEKT